MSSKRFSFKRFKLAASAFGADVNGNFALMTGVMLVPLMGFGSLALDHWKVASAKSDIENAADAAALGAINRASAIMRQTGDRNNAISEGKLAGADQFGGNAGKIPDTKTSTPVITVVISGLEVTASVTWNANVTTTLGSFFNWSNQNIKGASRAAVTMPPYVQIHVVVDNSASMGIGATAEEQAKMFNDAFIGCAVACHLGGGHTTYAHTKMTGIQTRIDVVKNVLVRVAESVTQRTTIPNQIKIGVSTFSNEYSEFVKITDPAASNMTAFRDKMSKLELASTGGGTDFHNALKQARDKLPAGGDGLTESRPLLYVFFITDGVEHSVQRKPGPPAWEVDPDLVNKFVTPHPTVNSNYVSTYRYGGVTRDNDTGWVQPLDPNLCRGVKDRGANLLTLEIEYVVPIEQHWKHDGEKDIRFGWIKDNILKAEGNHTLSHNRFRACASKPEDASLARSKTEIEDAIQAMFEKVLPKPPRLLL